MTKISFVYFDVGGVVVQDFSGNNKRHEMFEFIGVPATREKKFGKYFDQVEINSSRGVDIDTFKPDLISKFNLIIPANFSFLDYFANHLESNPSLWPLIYSLKVNYKIGLLTDMYPGLLDRIRELDLLPPVNWDTIIDSSVEKFQKPDKKLYLIAEKRTGVRPQEILFVDNLQVNLNPAIERGWQTFLYDPRELQKSSQELSDLLSHNL